MKKDHQRENTFNYADHLEEAIELSKITEHTSDTVRQNDWHSTPVSIQPLLFNPSSFSPASFAYTWPAFDSSCPPLTVTSRQAQIENLTFCFITAQQRQAMGEPDDDWVTLTYEFTWRKMNIWKKRNKRRCQNGRRLNRARKWLYIERNQLKMKRLFRMQRGRRELEGDRKVNKYNY